MSRVIVLVLLLTTLTFAASAPTLAMKWDTSLTLWMREVGKRTTPHVWSYKEYKMWQQTKKDWKEFEEFVDRTYKSR